MVSRFEYSGPWIGAGLILAIASIVMIIVTFQSIQVYYIPENDNGDTVKDQCENWEKNGVNIGCQEYRHNIYRGIWGTLLSIGLISMCFAQSRYIESQEGGLPDSYQTPTTDDDKL